MARTLAVLVAALAAILILPADAAEEVTVRFTSFSAWTSVDLPLRFSLVVRNSSARPVEEAGIKLTIYERVLSRSSLRQALDGRPLGDELAVTTEELAGALAPGEERAVTVERELSSLANVFRRGRRGSGGVYPVRIQLRAGGRTLAAGTSAMVFFSSLPERRLNVAWILPIHRPPAFEGDGSYAGAAIDREVLADGSVTRMAAALAAHPQVPLTIAASGILLDELADVADGYRRREPGAIRDVGADDPAARAAAGALVALKAAAGAPAAEVAAVPYAAADLVALVHGDLSGDVGRQLVLGRARAAEMLGREPTPALLVPAVLRLDARSAAGVAALGIRRLVLDPALLPPQGGLFGPDRPVRVTGTGGVRFDALLADAPIRERLEAVEDVDPVLVAQGVLAETASSWFERPLFADGRGIAIATARMPDPAVVGPLLDGLASAPWIRMRTGSDLLAAVPPREDLQPLAIGGPGQRSVLTAVRTARRAVQTLDRIVVEPVEAVEPLERLLLAAESSDWADRPARGIALARSARARAEESLAKIRTPGRQVTLTSRTGQLPVTLLNDTGYVVRVRVRLESVKVEFPDGSARVVELAQRATTLTFPVVARATGAFGVAVQIRTPDGEDLIGTGRVEVRSTAVSAVALAVTGGAGLFLIAAWARRSIRRRTPPSDGPPVADA